MIKTHSNISPIQGKKILITRPEEQARSFAEKLSSLGAEPINLPAIKISPATENIPLLQEVILKLNQYDWLIFTSTNAVKYFMQNVPKADVLAKNGIKSVKIATVGLSTATFIEKEYHIKPDLIPNIYTAEVLNQDIGDVKGLKILLPNADIARPELKNALQKKGAVIDEITLYHTQPNNISKEVLEKVFEGRGVDVVTFTSSSAVKAMINLLENTNFDLNNYIITCIGPETAKTAEALGLNVAIIGNPHTTDGMISEMIKYFDNQNKNSKS